MKPCWKTLTKQSISICVLVFHFSLFTQTIDKDYTFKSITTEEGLSNNVVFDIHQDREGYIWIATNNGLNRYDGYSITTFFHSEKDSTSISSNVVRAIIEDQEGRLWFGTKNGLNLFNTSEQHFEKPIKLIDSSFVNQKIMSMAHDSVGRIWITTSNDVGYFYPKSLNVELILSLETVPYTTLADDKVWIYNTKGEVQYYDINTEELSTESNISTNASVFFGEYSKKLWLPYSNNTPIDSSKFRFLPKLPNNIKPFRLLELNSNKSWIATDSGIYEFNYKTKELSQFSLGPSTLINQIRSIYKDRHDGIWIGTLGGLFHYDPYRKVFHHKDLIEDHDDIIMGMCADKEGVYANALGKSIFYKSHDSIVFRKINLPDAFPAEGLFVWDMETVPENKFPLWMSTNKGLICLNVKTSEYRMVDIPVDSLDESISFTLLSTDNDYMWLALHKSIHKISKTEGKVISSHALSNLIQYSGIQKIMALKDHIFIATEGDGLLAFNIKTENTLKITQANNQPLNASIWDLFVSNNTLWIGANDGLYRLDPNTMVIEVVLEDNQVVYSITEDDSKTLWMGTDKGIKSYDTKSPKVKYYTTIDGITNTEFNRKSVFRHENDQLWFGGVNGITTFHPTLIKKDNPNIPYVHITDLRVATSDSTFSVANFKHKITLPWKHNTVEIEYVGLNYTNSSQNSYRYIMDGHDPNWVETNKPNTARYVKLPVGTYDFKVNAANNDGIWNTKGDLIEITITPPFWRTKTAFVFYILSFIGLIALFRQLKMYRNRVSEVELEKEVIAKKVEEKFIVLNNKTKVYLNELKFVKAAGNYLEFHTTSKTHIDRNKLKVIEAKLPPNFIRTHRSYIVNKNYIVSASSQSVIISPNIETSLSRTFKGSLK